MEGDKANFDKGLSDFKTKFTALINEAKGIDSTTIAKQKESLVKVEEQLNKSFAAKLKNEEIFNALKGKPSASFEYDNINGKKTSLADLKGKYVFIDFWATWCGPCKKEIPFLKTLEEKYHDKNIEFVSISLDQNKTAWEKMVADKELGGVQLHFGDDRQLVTAYNVTTIPRFVLLDTNGNIVDANAPKPSSQNLEKLF